MCVAPLVRLGCASPGAGAGSRPRRRVVRVSITGIGGKFLRSTPNLASIVLPEAAGAKLASASGPVFTISQKLLLRREGDSY